MTHPQYVISIAEVALDVDRGLIVIPDRNALSDLVHIYRDASGIRWAPDLRGLVAYEPTRWEPLALFRQILGAAFREYSVCLAVTATTQWRGVPSELRARIEALPTASPGLHV